MSIPEMNGVGLATGLVERNQESGRRLQQWKAELETFPNSTLIDADESPDPEVLLMGYLPVGPGDGHDIYFNFSNNDSAIVRSTCDCSGKACFARESFPENFTGTWREVHAKIAELVGASIPNVPTPPPKFQ